MKKQNKHKESEKELKKFANQMMESYKKTNMINEFCTIKNFDSQQEEFIQIGERIKLPENFFIQKSDTYQDNRILAGDLIRSIVNGEKDFILKTISVSEDIDNLKISKFDYGELSKTISEMGHPTDIFFPLEPFFKLLHFWMREYPEIIQFSQDRRAPTLLVNGRMLRVHWITSRQEINKIIVVNKDRLDIIRKKFEDSKIPKEINQIQLFKDFSKNNNLMLYFGESEDANFDFIFRTVISKPKLSEGVAMTIEVGA